MVIDGAAIQVPQEVIEPICLHNNVMGHHVMCAFVLTGQFKCCFQYIAHI